MHVLCLHTLSLIKFSEAKEADQQEIYGVAAKLGLLDKIRPPKVEDLAERQKYIASIESADAANFNGEFKSEAVLKYLKP